jgi:phage virion morphogenesis protein
MAGASLTLDLDSRPLKRALSALERAGADLRPLFRDWGEELLIRHDRRWDREQAPDGTPWEPLDPEYAARKADARPNAGLLVFDENMRRLHYNAHPDRLEFGANEIYAATHQFGDPGRGIPQREFLGVSDADREALLDIARDYFQEALRKGKI